MKRVLLWPSLLFLALAMGGFWLSSGLHRPANLVVLASPAEPHTLDPAEMSWMQDLRLAMGLWEGLTSYDPKTLTPQPGVAREWRVSDEGKTYRFTLRPEARWSNGDPVVAGDFLYAWQRLLEPTTASEYRELFFLVAGAQAYHEARSAGRVADFSQVAVRALDPLSLEIRLARPCPYFLDLVAFPTFYPLHQASRQRLQGAEAIRWTHPPYLVSNGPYYLADWRFKQFVELAPNPHYWDAAPRPRVRVVTYEDDQAAFLAYRTGVVDVLTSLPGAFGPELLGRRDLFYRPVFGSYYYLFNCRRKPLDDPRVRQALTLVVDRRRLVEQVTRLHQEPLQVLVPPGYLPGYASPRGLERNTVRARQLLAQAGFPGGVGLGTLELLYNKEGMHTRLAQAIAQMWQEELGVQVSFREVESRTFNGERKKGAHFDICRAGWYGDYMDPTTWLDLFRTGQANNDGGFSDRLYDQLLDRAGQEADAGKRLELLTQAERRLVEEQAALLPLFQYSDGYLFNPDRIGGLEPNVRLLMQLKSLRLLAAKPPGS